MSGSENKINPVLVVLCMLVCVGAGFILPQSSARTSANTQSSDSDVVLALSDTESQPSETVEPSEETTLAADEQDIEAFNTDQPENAQADQPVTEETTAVSEAAEEETEAQTESQETAQTQTAASPEASQGTWTANGSCWQFLVNGTPFVGWFTDTDGKRYYFDADGSMHTGWLEDNGKQYYFDLDGILQTKPVTIDGTTYNLGSDGALIQ